MSHEQRSVDLQGTYGGIRGWLLAASSLAVVLAGAAMLLAEKPQPAAPAGQADAQVEKLVTRGLAAYKAGNRDEAIELLQQAIRAIQDEMGQNLGRFLPPAPAGWQAGQVSADASAYSGAQAGVAVTQVSRRYTRQADDADVEITITNAPALVQTTQAMAEQYKNPEFQRMAAMAGQNIEFIDQDGWIGWIEPAQATLLHGQCLLSIRGSDAAAIKLFVAAMDLKGLAAAQKPAAQPAASPTVTPTPSGQAR